MYGNAIHLPLEEELENMDYETPEQEEIRDNVKKYVEEQEIKQENNHNKQIELLYRVLQEEDQKNGDKASYKDANYANKNTDKEYYEPYCINCLQEPCTWVKNCCAMKRIDCQNIQQKGRVNLPNDGGKSCHYPLYRKMVMIQ